MSKLGELGLPSVPEGPAVSVDACLRGEVALVSNLASLVDRRGRFLPVARHRLIDARVDTLGQLLCCLQDLFEHLHSVFMTGVTLLYRRGRG